MILPLLALMAADVLRSEEPLFWGVAAVAGTTVVTLFFRLVLNQLAADGRRFALHPARIPPTRAWAGLVVVAGLCLAAILGAPHSEFLTPFMLAVVLQGPWLNGTQRA